jgi:hypothetical protein
VPIVFCETRALAEEWTYRYLAAAHTWATDETSATARIGDKAPSDLATAPPEPEPSTAEVRAWARSQGLQVPKAGRLRPEIWTAYRTAHSPGSPDPGA